MSAIGESSGFSLDGFIARHRLPASFAATANHYFLPLVKWVRYVPGEPFGRICGGG